MTKYLIILAAILVLRFVLYRWLKRVFMALLVRFGARVGLEEVGRQPVGKQPERITLVHRDLSSWRPAPAVAAFADPLFAKDFQEAGLFAIQEMPGVLVRFLAKVADGLVATIYTHPAAGVWLDLATFYQDGRSTTFSSNPAPELSQHPHHRTVNSPGSGALDLLTECLADRPKAPFKSILPEDVASVFENSYAEAIAWRKNKGAGAAEVARVALRKQAS